MLSRVLHNAGASVYTRVELDKLDAAHRRHLRRILGVFYPEHISNEETCRRTETRPISIDVIEKRWTLLGHTLRLAKDTTGNKVITQYFQSTVTGTKYKQSKEQGSQPEEDVYSLRYQDYYNETSEKSLQCMKEGHTLTLMI